MKNILFVYHASNIGGGTYCLLNILKEIDRRIYKPCVLLCEDGALVNEIKALGIEVFFMDSMTLIPYNRPIWGRGGMSAYFKIVRSFTDFDNLLNKIRPDAVYFNTMMLASYLEVAKKKGCKTIIHLREHWPHNEHVKQLSRLQSTISSYADKIIAINSYSASLIPNREVKIVYDWIDLSKRYEYRPFDDIFKEDTSRLKVYLFTGGLQDIKGAAEVIDVFRKRILDNNKRLLLVGVEPHPNYTGLKNKIRLFLSKVGINVYEYKVRNMIQSDHRIVCIPATYAIRHIMEQAYCNLSFFTIPHANLALAESIIVGTVPVAARTEESVEYSGGEEFALLFELGNQDDMIKKLNELDENYEVIKVKVKKGSQAISKIFNKERNVALLHSVLEDLFVN
jgi:glycosyltransferase involved in cell wall biosynthesis